jgi:formylglycine-generating enzyme required for sulfatase activity
MGGSEPLQYIWFKDNVPLLDHAVKGTKSVLRIDPATLEDAGVYLVAVANPAGNVRSAGISLEVLPLPPEPITIAGLVDGMVPIPAGTFVMGSPDDEEGRGRGEGPQTTVTISKPFWMGKYEVTQGQYEEIMGENPSWFNGTRIVGSDTGVFGTDLSRPVEQVGWEKVMEFCKRLTEQEHASGRLAADHEYRLPTAAQWEYACRAGTTTRFSYGDDYITKQGKHYGYAELGTYAWHASNSEAVTHSVGGKLPNPWGLYDMHGNVHEWCQNQADGSYRYPGGEQTDPVGPNSSRSSRVHRGGSAFTGALGCRSANRGGSSISDLGILGFRPVLVPVDYPKSP